MQWVSAISTEEEFSKALGELSDTVERDLGGSKPDLLFAFVTPHHRTNFVRVHKTIAERFPGVPIVGSSAGGVIGGGREVEASAGLVITAAVLPEVDVDPFHLAAGALPPLGVEAEGWCARLGIAQRPPAAMIVVPDPYTTDAEALVERLDHAFPETTKIGGLASGSNQPGQTVLFSAGETHGTGVVGVAMSGNLLVETIVSQGCRPIGTPMFVTRAERHVVHELDGQRPAVVLQELYETLPERDRQLMRFSLFVGLVMTDSQESYSHGDFLIRNIIGLDAQSGALAISGHAEKNSIVQFHLRDAETSAADLEALLAAQVEANPAPPSGALLFSCMGRGEGLYGAPNHDTNLFQDRLGPVPLGGFFCNGEIGPLEGQTYLHGYTSAFAMFRPRQAH